MLRAALITALLVFSTSASDAQTAVDASGHWVGTVNMPTMQIGVEVDLAKLPSGQYSGTLTIPSQKLRGLPLSKVDVKGTSITFEARADQGFNGLLSADGQTMSGGFAFQVYTFPFTLTRMGNARIDAPPTSAPIGNELEGTWNGTLSANGTQMRVRLKLANHPNGTSTGSLSNLDEGSLELPIAVITQKGSDVTLAFKVVDASYAAVLNADRGELAGTWIEGGVSAPLTFTREVSGR